jgi:hypothetical protein
MILFLIIIVKVFWEFFKEEMDVGMDWKMEKLINAQNFAL